jgi:uncharacterized glyoxalase superfamily protein PhnB
VAQELDGGVGDLHSVAFVLLDLTCLANPSIQYREISRRGIRAAEPPEDTPWQTREMNIIDPDGNRLRFANAGGR